jgi:hypothetical protein
VWAIDGQQKKDTVIAIATLSNDLQLPRSIVWSYVPGYQSSKTK